MTSRTINHSVTVPRTKIKGQGILTNPVSTIDHVMARGGQAVKGFYGTVDGKDVIIYVAKTDKGKIKAGDIVTAIQPSQKQMSNLGL